jgi:hypothetical protein
VAVHPEAHRREGFHRVSDAAQDLERKGNQVTDIITLTNPADGTTWTSGKRGRKPKWVMELEAAGTVIPKKVAAPKSFNVATALPPVAGALRVWKYVGQAGEDGDNDKHQTTVRILIIAANPVEAMKVANRTFLNQMSASELAGMWQEETDVTNISNLHGSGFNVTKPAIWQFVKQEWSIRPNLKEYAHA